MAPEGHPRSSRYARSAVIEWNSARASRFDVRHGARRRAGPARSDRDHRRAGRSAAATVAISARACSSDQQLRVEGDSGDLRRRDDVGRQFVEADVLGHRLDGRSPPVFCPPNRSGSTAARLVHQHHGMRRGAMHQAQRHRRVGGMVDGALALHEDPIGHAPPPAPRATPRCRR